MKKVFLSALIAIASLSACTNSTSTDGTLQQDSSAALELDSTQVQGDSTKLDSVGTESDSTLTK